MSGWLKKDDRVLVIAGNDKGKTGVILARGEEKLLVQGINIKKKHMKKRSENSRSEIMSIETPIHISNVAPCTQEGKKIKLKSKVTDSGEKILYYLEDDEEVVYRTLKKNKKSR
jgi:large subunit ribosomal protein L24